MDQGHGTDGEEINDRQLRVLVYREVNKVIEENWAADGNYDAPPVVGEEDNLYDAGVVDSFAMVEVIALVEELCGGEPIDFMDVDPDEFFTMRGIYSFVRDRMGGRISS